MKSIVIQERVSRVLSIEWKGNWGVEGGIVDDVWQQFRHLYVSHVK